MSFLIEVFVNNFGESCRGFFHGLVTLPEACACGRNLIQRDMKLQNRPLGTCPDGSFCIWRVFVQVRENSGTMTR